MPRTKQKSNSIELTSPGLSARQRNELERQGFPYIYSPAELASANNSYFKEFQARSFLAQSGNNPNAAVLQLDVERGRVCFAEVEDGQNVGNAIDDFFDGHEELKQALVKTYSQGSFQVLADAINRFLLKNGFKLINQNQGSSQDKVTFKIIDNELFAEVTCSVVTLCKVDFTQIATIPGQAKAEFKLVTKKINVDSQAIKSESFLEYELVKIGNLLGLQKKNSETDTSFATRVKKYFKENKDTQVECELQGFRLCYVASTTPELDKLLKCDVTVFESLHRIAQKKAAWLNQCCINFETDNELPSIAVNVGVDCSSYLDEPNNQSLITNYQKAHAAFLAAEEETFTKAKDELMFAYGALMLDFGKWLRAQREDMVSKNGTFFIAGEDIPELKNKFNAQVAGLVKNTLVIDKRWLDENGYKPQQGSYGDDGKLIDGFVRDYPRRMKNKGWIFHQDDTVIGNDVDFNSAQSFIDSLHCDDDVKRCVTYFIYQSGVVGALNILLTNLLLDPSGKMSAIDLNDHRILLHFLSKDKFNAEVNVLAYLSILDKSGGIKKLVVSINAQLQVDCGNRVAPQVIISSLNFSATKKPIASTLYKFLPGALTLDKTQIEDTDLLMPYALDIAAIFEASSRDKSNYEKHFKEGLHTFSAFDWFEVKEKNDELSRKVNAIFEKVYSANPVTVSSWLKAASDLSQLAVDRDSNSPRRAALVSIVNGIVAELRKICVAHNEISILATINMHRFELQEHRKWLTQRCIQLDPDVELLQLAKNVGVDVSQYKNDQGLFIKYKQAFRDFLQTPAHSIKEFERVQEQLIWAYHALRMNFDPWLHEQCRESVDQKGFIFVTAEKADRLKKQLEDNLKQLLVHLLSSNSDWLNQNGYGNVESGFERDYNADAQSIWTFIQDDAVINTQNLTAENLLNTWATNIKIKKAMMGIVFQGGLMHQVICLFSGLFRHPQGEGIIFFPQFRKLKIVLLPTGFHIDLNVVDCITSTVSEVPTVHATFTLNVDCADSKNPKIDSTFTISTAKPVNNSFLFRITNGALNQGQTNIEATDLLIPYTLQLAKVFSATPDQLAQHESRFKKNGFYIDAPLQLSELEKNQDDPLNQKVKSIIEDLYQNQVITEAAWIKAAQAMIAIATEINDSRHLALKEIGYRILKDIVLIKQSHLNNDFEAALATVVEPPEQRHELKEFLSLSDLRAPLSRLISLIDQKNYPKLCLILETIRLNDLLLGKFPLKKYLDARELFSVISEVELKPEAEENAADLNNAALRAALLGYLFGSENADSLSKLPSLIKLLVDNDWALVISEARESEVGKAALEKSQREKQGINEYHKFIARDDVKKQPELLRWLQQEEVAKKLKKVWQDPKKIPLDLNAVNEKLSQAESIKADSVLLTALGVKLKEKESEDDRIVEEIERPLLIAEAQWVHAVNQFIHSPTIKTQEQLFKILCKPCFVDWLRVHWQVSANRIADSDSFLENLYVQLAQATTPSLVRQALGQCFFPGNKELQEKFNSHAEDINLLDHTNAHEPLVAEACEYLHRKYHTAEHLNDEKVKLAVEAHKKHLQLREYCKEKVGVQDAKEEYLQQKQLGLELMLRVDFERKYFAKQNNKTAYDALMRAKMALQWTRDVWVAASESLNGKQDTNSRKIQTGYEKLIGEANKRLIFANETLVQFASIKNEEQTTSGIAKKSFYSNLINYNPETYKADIEREKDEADKAINIADVRIAAASEVQPPIQLLSVEKIAEQLQQPEIGQTVVLAAALAQSPDKSHEINLLTTVTHKKEEEKEWYWLRSENRPEKPGFFASSAEKEQYETALRLNAAIIVYWSNKLATENKDSSIFIKERDPQYVADLLMAIEAIRLRYVKEGKQHADFVVTHSIPRADLAEKARGKAKSFYKKHYAALDKPLVVAKEIEELAEQVGFRPSVTA